MYIYLKHELIPIYTKVLCNIINIKCNSKNYYLRDNIND